MNDVRIIQPVPSSLSTNHPDTIMDRPPLMKRPHNYLSWWIWAVYALLAGISIPWYWPAADTRMLLGFPPLGGGLRRRFAGRLGLHRLALCLPVAG
jgi:hypothetical protein